MKEQQEVMTQFYLAEEAGAEPRGVLSAAIQV